MVLMRRRSASAARTCRPAVNVVQCLGWTIFELLVIATAAAALSDELFGFEARWAWTLVFGAAALVARAARPDRRRAHGDPPRRGLGRPARGRVPRVVGAHRRRARGGVEPARRGRPLDVAGDRHRRRRHGFVDPARGRLHALRPHPAGGVLGHGDRLLRPGRAAARARRGRPADPRRRRRRRSSPPRSRPAASSRCSRCSR